MNFNLQLPEGDIRRAKTRKTDGERFDGIRVVDRDTGEDVLTLYTSKGEWFVVSREPVTVRQMEVPKAEQH